MLCRIHCRIAVCDYILTGLHDTRYRVIDSFTRNSGQICIAGTRVYVKDTIFDNFAIKLVEGIQALKFGDPKDQSTNAGSQADDI